MQITLTIPDTKADSFLDVLRHISYVEIASSDALDHLSSAYEEDEYDEEEKISAEQFYQDLKEALHEVKEDIAGRKKLRPIEEFLAELQGESVGQI